jgi:tRNA (guanine37-N1)-methyltransferase
MEAWGVRVAAGSAEEARRRLRDAGILDPAARPAHDGGDIIFPVIEEVPGAERYLFARRPPREELPRHELVGGIAILHEDSPEKAGLLLKSRPSIHTVLFPESEVSGTHRIRSFRVLAGKPVTSTTVTEHHHIFEVDLSEAYFSARLATERQRLAAEVRAGDHVLDMFAGVGPFAVCLSEKAAIVVASDLNPAAVTLMRRNCAANRVRNVVPFLADADHLQSLLPRIFDRVVMNLPLDSRRFVPVAFSLCREGGTIYWYVLQSEEHEFFPALDRLPAASVRERFVRSYSPGKHHAVYEVVVGPD